MWKKSFGVAFSALLVTVAGYGAGCSSSSTTPADTGDGGGDGATRRDSGGAGDSGNTDTDGGACPGAAPTAADLDQAGGWKPPNAINKTACSRGDISTFEGNFQNAQTYNDLVKGLPTGCAQCILSKETDAKWQFIVTDATGQAGFFNYGSCYAVAPNGSEACGKAVQYDEFCLNVSCSDCPDAQFSSCKQSKATQQACAANFAAGIQSGCGTDQAKLTALDDACGSALDAVNILCSSGNPLDGGGGGG